MARKQNKQNRFTRLRKFRNSNIITKLIDSCVGILGNPLFMIAVAVSLYLYLNPTIITNFCAKFYKSELLKPIFEYIATRPQQTAGFVLAGTASLTVLPTRYSFASFIVLGILIFTCPQAEYLEYFLLTAFTTLFIKIRNIRARIVLLVVIILTLALGWWGKKLWKLQDCSAIKTQTECSTYSCSWNSSARACQSAS